MDKKNHKIQMKVCHNNLFLQLKYKVFKILQSLTVNLLYQIFNLYLINIFSATDFILSGFQCNWSLKFRIKVLINISIKSKLFNNILN